MMLNAVHSTHSTLPFESNVNDDGRWILSTGAHTSRCIVIHFNLRNHENVVLEWWSGRPFLIAVAARSLTLAHASLVSSKFFKADTQHQEWGFLPPVVP